MALVWRNRQVKYTLGRIAHIRSLTQDSKHASIVSISCSLHFFLYSMRDEVPSHLLTPHLFTVNDTSDDWSDDEPNAGPSSSQIDPSRRIAILERKLQQAKQDLVDYKALVSQRLDLSRLQDAMTEPSGSSKVVERDDDSHYFQSYGQNG